MHQAGSATQSVNFVRQAAHKENNSQEAMGSHLWSDRKHAMTKPKRKKNDTPLHPSVEAIFAYYEKTGKVPSPTATKADLPLVVPRTFTARELTMMLKKEFPRLF